MVFHNGKFEVTEDGYAKEYGSFLAWLPTKENNAENAPGMLL